MKRSRSNWRTETPFDAFLEASAGTDSNGIEVSTLSALARLDLDPWIEATTLALMPVETATTRLAAKLALVFGSAAERRRAREVAAGLIALLPRPGSTANPNAALGSTAPPPPAGGYSRAVILILLLSLVLGAQWMRQEDTVADHTPGITSIQAEPSPFADPH